ncbi:unnamed protein product, partial [Pylaiella littoralis]
LATNDRWRNEILQIAVSSQLKAVHRHLPTMCADGRLIPPKDAAADAPRTSDAGARAAFKGKGKGPASKGKLLSPAEVAAAFNSKFPQAPICRPAENVETRALAAMQPTAAMKKKATAKDGRVDEVRLGELVREAAMAVFATVSVLVAVYVHEIVFFNLLVRDKRFQMLTAAGMGVMMMCPSCLTNKFVHPPGVSGNGFPSIFSQKVRVAHDVDGVVAPLHAKYRCKNPQCPMVIESARRSAANVSRGAGAVEARE